MNHIAPRTWLAESILVTMFCCLPFGIVGIVHASKVNSLFATGNHDEAEKASAKARKWTTIAFFTGIAFYAIYFLLILFLGLYQLKY